jgi:hypothetical protein
MSFIGSSNKQNNQYYILIPKKEFVKVQGFEGEKIKATIKDIMNNNELSILTQVTTQGKNHFLPIYTKYLKDFNDFLNRDLKITLEKI